MEEKRLPKEDYTPNGKPKYTIVKDGNNQEYKIVNFDNEEMVPNTGIKIVRAIRKSSRHQPASVTRLERDPITGIIYGIPAGLNEMTKNLRFQSIELNDQVQFDLKIREDRMRWAVVSRAKFLQGSPYAKGKPSHVLYDVEAESVAKVQTVNERKIAYATMEGLSHLQTLDMARNVGGINVVNNSIPVITAEIYDFIDSKEANKGAKKFNEIWKMSNREAMTVFNRCKAVGLVSFDVNSGWLWKLASVLGTTEPQAIDAITQNTALLTAMDNESRSMDAAFEANATEEEKTKFISAIPIPKGVDNEILKKIDKRMAEMDIKEKELRALLDKIPMAGNIDLDAKPEVVGGDDELSLLRKTAKAMGMTHAFLPASTKEKITEWMEKKKTSQ